MIDFLLTSRYNEARIDGGRCLRGGGARRFCLNFRSYAVAITAISGGCRQDASVPGATA